MLPTKQKEKIFTVYKQQYKAGGTDNIALPKARPHAGFEKWLNTGDYKKLVAGPTKIPNHGPQAYFTLLIKVTHNNINSEQAILRKRCLHR